MWSEKNACCWLDLARSCEIRNSITCFYPWHFSFQYGAHNGQTMRHYIIKVWTLRRTVRAQGSMWGWVNNSVLCLYLYITYCPLSHLHLFCFVNTNLFELTHLRILRGTVRICLKWGLWSKHKTAVAHNHVLLAVYLLYNQSRIPAHLYQCSGEGLS